MSFAIFIQVMCTVRTHLRRYGQFYCSCMQCLYYFWLKLFKNYKNQLPLARFTITHTVWFAVCCCKLEGVRTGLCTVCIVFRY